MFRLLSIVARLRAPDGCPWDIEQTPQTITPHIIEEAYELVDAIEREDTSAMIDELSDQLLHVVMISQMMAEKNEFKMADVIHHCCEKMIRRHPHVFGDKSAKNVADVSKHWEAIKQKESGDLGKDLSLMDGIPNHFPALLHAQKIQKKATRIGFDWSHIDDVKDALKNEVNEWLAAESADDVEHELGDVLFSIVNLCRWMGVSAEDLLQRANKRFKKRFQCLERIIKSHHPEGIENVSESILTIYWDQAKKLSD